METNMSIIWSKRINSAGQILEALQQGFSAIDFSLTELTNSSSEELKLIKSLLAQTNLRVASFSNLLPDDVTVTSSGFNDYVWLLYVKKTLEQIGVKVAPLLNKCIDAILDWKSFTHLNCHNYAVGLITLVGLNRKCCRVYKYFSS